MDKRFKETIKAYLDARAKEDALFAEKYANPAKNIDDCAAYIISTVQEEGGCAYTDDEVFGMAVHYYDEENPDFNRDATCTVIDNHSIPLTEDEKAEARQRAMKRYEDAELARLNAERKAEGSKVKKAAEKATPAKPKTEKKETPAESVSGLLKQLELF